MLILGPPGVGKTHLAVGLGLKAIDHGYQVLFTTAAAMIATLTRALAEGRLEDKLKVCPVFRLPIVDETGYLPTERTGANLFFRLISQQCQHRSLLITSNLDRILHHAVTINIRSNACGLKEKLKAGLLKATEEEPTA